MNNTNKNPSTFVNGFSFGGATRNRTGDEGFADLCLTAWLWRRIQFGTGAFPSFRILFKSRTVRYCF